MEASDKDVQGVVTIFYLKQSEVLPVDAGQLGKETRQDPELSKVIQYFNKEGRVRWHHLSIPITVSKEI